MKQKEVGTEDSRVLAKAMKDIHLKVLVLEVAPTESTQLI